MFSYTVGTGDDDSDGIWWGVNSFRLDSDDSITGVVNGLDADLDHTPLNKLAKTIASTRTPERSPRR